MSRRIITTKLQAAGADQEVDTYFDKLIKYIPADLVAAWTVATGLIAGADEEMQGNLLWIVFVVGLVLTPLWTWRQTQKTGLPPAVTQIVISTLAFIVWIFALGGPFSRMGWYQPLYGSLLLIGYTLVVPLINPQES